MPTIGKVRTSVIVNESALAAVRLASNGVAFFLLTALLDGVAVARTPPPPPWRNFGKFEEQILQLRTGAHTASKFPGK